MVSELEIKMHLRVYQKRPDVKAVVHARPIYATSFAIAGIPLTEPIMPEAVIALGYVPIAEYGTPSTVEVPDNIEKYLPYFDAILLENHGALAYSDSLLAAYHKMESLNFMPNSSLIQDSLALPKNSATSKSSVFMKSEDSLAYPASILPTFAPLL